MVEPGLHGSQAAEFTALSSLIPEAPLEGPMAKGSGDPRGPQGLQGQTVHAWALEGRAGETHVPGSLQLLVEALSPCHYSLKSRKFLWERCLRATKSLRNSRCFT